jgi:hypothetical protein
MHTEPPYINHWKCLPDCVIQSGRHDSFTNDKALAYKTEIQRVLGISQSTFYRKIKQPTAF